MSAKRPVSSKWYRAVLTDVQPYELPVTISSGALYDALLALDLVWKDQSISCRWLGSHTAPLLTTIFGRHITLSNRDADGRVEFVDESLRLSNNRLRDFPRAVPLSFEVEKVGGGTRVLSMLHPRSQVEVARFYERFSDSILYFTNRSSFSIRRPVRIARYAQHRDVLFAQDRHVGARGVELSAQDYDGLHSYFAYGRYDFVYKFYESAELRRLETMFARFARFDIANCFGSIYTHSISWVTNGFNASKMHSGATNGTFGGQFDRLMQSLNDDETKGIVVGPEISRIFAEVILQDADIKVGRLLEQLGWRQGVDFEIRRFVDDYFVFVHSDRQVSDVGNTLRQVLGEYRLSLNAAKYEVSVTPLRDEVSVAKSELRRRLSEAFVFDDSDHGVSLPRPRLDVKQVGHQFKGVLLQTRTLRHEVASYALSRVEIEFERVLRAWRGSLLDLKASPVDDDDWDCIGIFIIDTLDVATSFYGSSESVSPALKLARIASTSIAFADSVSMPYSFRSQILANISRALRGQILRGAVATSSRTHTFVLLDCLTALDTRNALHDGDLRRLLDPRQQGLDAVKALELIVVLRHCGEGRGLESLREDLERVALTRVNERPRGFDTERTLLASALLASPFSARQTKRSLMKSVSYPDLTLLGEAQATAGPVAWRALDYHRALQRKRGLEVY